MKPAFKAILTHYYPGLTLTPIERIQLDWLPLMQKPGASPPQVLSIPSDHLDTSRIPAEEEARKVHFEFLRTLNRLDNLRLLREAYLAIQRGQGDTFSALHSNFIAYQSEPKLSRESFADCAKVIGSLTNEEYAVVRASTLVAAVTLSDVAKAKASGAVTTGEQAHELALAQKDSVAFSVYTMTHMPEIYPVYEALRDCENGAKLARKLQAIFSVNTHFRHLLFAEGNRGMITHLEAFIRRHREANGDLINDAVKLWRCHWEIGDLAGFDLVPLKMGASGLNEHRWKAAETLYHQIENWILELLTRLLAEDVSRDLPNPVERYVLQRANWLNISRDVAKAERALLGKLAAMMQLFIKEEGDKLVGAWLALKSVLGPEQAIPSSEEKTLTPTYLPAVFRNLFTLSQDLGVTLHLGMIIYLRAWEQYDKNSVLPLSFRSVADIKSLERLWAAFRLEARDTWPEVTLSDDQVVQTRLPLRELHSSHVVWPAGSSAQSREAAVGVEYKP